MTTGKVLKERRAPRERGLMGSGLTAIDGFAISTETGGFGGGASASAFAASTSVAFWFGSPAPAVVSNR